MIKAIGNPLAEHRRFGEMLRFDESLDPDYLVGDDYYYEVIADVHQKTPEQVYLEKETLQEVHTALDMLTQRMQVYLRYRFGFEDVEGRSLKDTAEHFSLARAVPGSLSKVLWQNSG